MCSFPARRASKQVIELKRNAVSNQTQHIPSVSMLIQMTRFIFYGALDGLEHTVSAVSKNDCHQGMEKKKVLHISKVYLHCLKTGT